MYPIVWTIILFIIAIFYLRYVFENRKYQDIEKIPGPPVNFFFGNIFEFGSNIVDVFYNTQRLIKTYGPLVRIWQGPFFGLRLLVTNPDHVEYFLSSNVHIKKSAGYNLYHSLLGEGLITSTGDKWRRHRKILTPAFHFKIVEQFFDIFHSSSTTLINRLKTEVDNKIDIFPLVKLYALDVLCESTMQTQIHIQEKPNHELIVASEGYMEIVIRRFFSVFKRVDFLFQYTRDSRELNKHVAFLQGFTRQVIQQRQNGRVGDSKTLIDQFGIKRKKAFMDVLLDSNELSDEDLREEVNTFLLAGHETMSSAISFGIFELAKHPDIQVRLLHEIHDIIGHDKAAQITLKTLQEMKYLDCVMKEILRVYPPVCMFERELTEDVVLDGLRIPKGTAISFQPYAQHRNEKYFPNPEMFDPDRFLVNDVETKHPFAYIPFSAGPRNCIGFRYALMNCKTAIANIIRNFYINPVKPEHKPMLANVASMISANGLPVILKLR